MLLMVSASPGDASETAELRNELGIIHARGGHLDDALRQFSLLLADDPQSAVALNNAGNVYFLQGVHERAHELYMQARLEAPEVGGILLNLGILESAEGQKLKAIRILERAIASERLGRSAIGEAHYRLGEIYIGLGRHDKAVIHFRASAEKAPNAEWGSQSQAYLDLLH